MHKLVLALALVGLSAPAFSQVGTTSSSMSIVRISGTVSGVTVVGNRGWPPMETGIPPRENGFDCEETDAADEPPTDTRFAAAFAAGARWQRWAPPAYGGEGMCD